MPRVLDRRKAMELYRQGLSDREIAKRLGVFHSSVTYWRRKQGLPPNGRIEDGAIGRLYDRGLTDRQIAEKLGISKGSVQTWRWRRKLPPNRSGSKGYPSVSICWDCANARANRCFAVPFERRSWVKKYEEHMASGALVRTVFECEQFERDGQDEMPDYSRPARPTGLQVR